ncbi:hypothetical protein LTR50_006736 [Elasticomyces elasticus]|nr:hypothetical protein LTR50_006736 [Elasticomyces elasticus]
MSDTDRSTGDRPLTRLPFPQLGKSHILHCSYHYWHPKYRSITPKARLIPLTQPFLSYLRADGIVLPSDDTQQRDWSDSDSGVFSSTDNREDSDADEDTDPSAQWHDVHEAVKATIAELGGKVVPKLNWSAPKDATWISTTNSMECRTPSDVYLLLKSSDFITHDLEHAFDDCVEDSEKSGPLRQETVPKTLQDIPYTLVLRKYILLNPSVEFRCFVRNRKLIALCQRDLNYFEFLFSLEHRLRDLIQSFFDQKLKDTFPDENFAFDVYVPPPHNRVWLIDINPWAQRTDPLLFSWLELLTMAEPPDTPKTEQTISLPLRQATIEGASETKDVIQDNRNAGERTDDTLDDDDFDSASSDSEVDEEMFEPEFRLVKRDDPEAYSFNTPQYSAHKLPRDVVDASQGGTGALREFADSWKAILAKRQKNEKSDDDDDDDDG